MMNKYLVIVLFLPLMVVAQQADTQNEGLLVSRADGSTAVGVRTGVNYSKTLLRDFDLSRAYYYMSRGMKEESLPIWTISGGVTIQQQLSTHWFLSADVLFQRKGFRIEIDIISNNDDYGSFLFNYFSLPVMINLESGGRISAYAGAGVYVSYLSSMHSVSPYSSESYHIVEETKVFEKMDFGLAAQAGLIIPVEACFKIELQGAYSYGLLSALNPEKDFYRNTRQYHRSLMISLGYLWLF